jgi:hypothetical protein
VLAKGHHRIVSDTPTKINGRMFIPYNGARSSIERIHEKSAATNTHGGHHEGSRYQCERYEKLSPLMTTLYKIVALFS